MYNIEELYECKFLSGNPACRMPYAHLHDRRAIVCDRLLSILVHHQ